MKLYTEELIYQVHLSIKELEIMFNTTHHDDIDDHIAKMQCWCDQTFGHDNYEYEYKDTVKDQLDIFKFKYDKHRTLFILKYTH